MHAKSFALVVAAAGQATATLDLLSGRPLSEAIFGLSSEQVKNVDNAVTRAEQNVQSSVLNAYNTASKTITKLFADIDKNSSPAVSDATNALHKALTPDVREKVKKAINSLVDSTLNSLL
ncbi:hypothetical protein H4R20_002968 [Coemansia guatemalensis]|uniref:Uncharacterized protein n=1 Tax=Coemansia guatemalensis TaxID=2761395 RepID=A0A9W8HZ00_9FUNG|nr:hypothetical protein H4R20_002968 [Coemansia guatemalensis]